MCSKQLPNGPQEEPSISFNSEEITYSLNNAPKIRSWIKSIIKKENGTLGTLSFVFCSDEYLLNINTQYLNHNYYTDIITFDYCEEKVISGDIFISIDRVTENAKEYSVSFDSELHRVIAHGVLHLLGYKDKLSEDALVMREKENFYLSFFKTLP